MFSYISFLFLLVQSITYGQTTYYIASAGSDSNSGITAGSPFQSITKINQLPLQAGDSVLFRRGDTFRGTLMIRRSGLANRSIVYDAYGTGQKPVIAGSIPVTNWSTAGGDLWKASCPSCGNSITGLYRNNKALPLGRYPNGDASNKGYLTIQAHTDKNQIVSQEHLPTTIDWKGAEAVMRPTQWIIDRAIIDHQVGDALYLINNSNYSPADGWGYFIQNHLATLDQNGEWYFDSANKTLWLYSAQTNPNSQTITATMQSRGIDAATVSNVVLRNLHITQTLNQGVRLSDIASFTMINNEITNSGEDGIAMEGAGTNVLIENNRIVDVNNNGVQIGTYQTITFKGNSLRRVGLVAGRGKGGDGHYNGLQSTANANVLIENNIIDSIGYNGVTFWNNTLIQRNVISNYCMTKSDGGALYAWNYPKYSMTNIQIISNIIYNGIGAPEGSLRKEYSGANGIFLDDCVENVELKNNTVFGNHQWGIYLHATSNITLTGNTSFDNGVSQFVMYHNGGYCPFQNNVVKYNSFVSRQISQLTADYESNTTDLAQYGTIDSNYYARPFSEPYTIQGIINSTQGGIYRLEDWKSFSNGKDIHSQRSPVTYNLYKNEGSGGKTRINSTFETSTDGWFILYSRYNNAEAAQDNTNKLDNGSLRVGFTNPSGQSGSYAQAVKPVAFIKGKTYVLRFDAVASVNVSILVYLRQYGSPFKEYERRYSPLITTTRKSYELFFTASDSDENAVVLFQIDGEGPTFWLDNVRLQEDVPIRNEPNEFITLFYNPTPKDSLIALTGNFRDVKNQAYTHSVILKPFTSLILLRDTLPLAPADLSLSLQSAKRILQINEPTALKLRISNQGTTPASLARWTYRSPANLQLIRENGQPYEDNVLTGTVSQLAPLADTSFTFSVKPMVAGLYRMAAQLTTATSPDPDSSPNSGTADGEDDAAMTELRAVGLTTNVYESPNPNQRVLPPVISTQPKTNPALADLSLRMVVSSRTAALGKVITFTLYVDNEGGSTANGVQLQVQLPDGLEYVTTETWQANGSSLTASLASVPSGSTIGTSFQARLKLPGRWINRAQINVSSVADPDSTPGNGFSNGEDDQAQIDIRSQ